MAKRMVTLRVEEAELAEIDRLAKAARLSRTRYLVGRALAGNATGVDRPAHERFVMPPTRMDRDHEDVTPRLKGGPRG